MKKFFLERDVTKGAQAFAFCFILFALILHLFLAKDQNIFAVAALSLAAGVHMAPFFEFITSLFINRESNQAGRSTRDEEPALSH